MAPADPLDDLFRKASTHGVPMAAICKRAQVDPTTPSRWKRKKNGATLDKVNQLASALDELIAARLTKEAA